MSNRRIDLFYSEEDEGYIARQADQHGISAFGETPEDALRELRVVFSMIETPPTKAASVPGDMADILCDVIIEARESNATPHRTTNGAWVHE